MNRRPSRRSQPRDRSLTRLEGNRRAGLHIYSSNDETIGWCGTQPAHISLINRRNSLNIAR